MATKNFPYVLKPDSESWGIKYNSMIFSSDFDGTVQTLSMPGAKWNCSMTFTEREGKAARQLQGFIVSLQGRAGRFWVIPTDWKPEGTAQGTPDTLAAVGNGVTVLETGGWDVNQSEALAIGDYFEVSGELKKVTDTVSSDGSGNATVHFGPPLRFGLGLGTQLRLIEPRCRMMVTSDSADWNVSSPVVYAQDIDCIEAID